jgi:NAD-dependent dihydropyrimidine dehydrogenase PreA subunit
MIEITWDAAKCPTPDSCRECLNVCPQGVFQIYPRNGRVAGMRTEDWAIGPLFHSLCTGCKVCEEACSTNAISVKLA